MLEGIKAGGRATVEDTIAQMRTRYSNGLVLPPGGSVATTGSGNDAW